MSELKKEYTNGELTIVWQPKKCIHAAECVKALPKVYTPQEKPWLHIDNATTRELKDQIGLCPSGALSFYMNDGSDEKNDSETTKVDVLPDGPLLVHGTIEVKDSKGSVSQHDKTTAFCRCGASTNKPYCDGTHLQIGFND